MPSNNGIKEKKPNWLTKPCRKCRKGKRVIGLALCRTCSSQAKKERELKRKLRRREQKENNITRLKKIAWDLCSLYNRKKDADENGMVKCVTCPKIAHYKKLQGGHFVPGRGNGVLFDDRGIHAQCYQCNCEKKGQWVEYEQYMLARYGKKVTDEIKANKFKVVKYTEEDYRRIADEYRQKLSTFSY